MTGITPPASGVRSVRRALAALDFLAAAAPAAVRVTDVAGHLGLSLATASRLLATLADSGYASRASERRFTVGPRSVLLAAEWVARLRAAAAGPFARVRAATGESVMLSQLLGGTAVPIAWHKPTGWAEEFSGKLAEASPGIPLSATATGRAMLGKLPAAQRARLLPAEPYPQFTGRTVTSWTDLRQIIRDGERGGLHIENGEADPDLWCCATALEPGPDGEILALAVVSLGEPAAPERARICRAMKQETRNVGYSLSPAG
jgi:DNA-binding IclR family transcriptional regulator